MATVLIALDAVDVAMTEASVGRRHLDGAAAGRAPPEQERGSEAGAPALAAAVRVGVTGGAAGLRHARPAGVLRSRGADPHACRAALSARRDASETGVPNVVTAVLASYRGYDTLGETTVIFTAGIGVIALLRRRRQRAGKEEPRSEARPHPARRRQADAAVHAAVRALRAVPRRLRAGRRLPGRRDHRRGGHPLRAHLRPGDGAQAHRARVRWSRR